MFDAKLRPLINPCLGWTASKLVRRGVAADTVTLTGFGFGLASAVFIAFDSVGFALFFICLNRLADGLDGAIARATHPTGLGGFLDITLDFAFYAAVPLAFAYLSPTANGLAASALIASFLINGSAFLAFATVAEKRGLISGAQGPKSFFYLAGVAEGGETIAAFVCFCLWPQHFPPLALCFSTVCLASAAGRILAGWRSLR